MRESLFLQEYEDLIRTEITQELMLKTLEYRFGKERIAGFADPIKKVHAMKDLQKLNRVAIKCRRPSEFRKALEENSRTKS